MDIVFDIETAPLPDCWLEELHPFKKGAVKLGNTKDSEKIAAKIKDAEENHLDNLRKGAALEAETGSVIAIGYKVPGKTPTILHLAERNEKQIIEDFWRTVGTYGRCIGHNIKRFDLPFLIRRSWYLGIPTDGIVKRGWKGRMEFDGESFVDLMEVWQLGTYQQFISLDRLARCFGVGSKTDDGKRFGEIYRTDREAALAYLRNDLDLIEGCATRMGVLDHVIDTENHF